jgi:cation diffusion facilitator family transporter
VEHGNVKAIRAALAANLGIAAAKFVGFLFTRSAAMLAESIHSLADTGNQGLLFLGARDARRKADAEHPFGYGRVRYFWAFVVALVLFSLGGLFSIAEGMDKILHPVPLESPEWALGILVFAIALEGWSLRTAVHNARPALAGASWWMFIRRSKSPELPVVLLEDTGALIGLACALAGVGLSAWTGEPRWDAAGSLAIGVLLVVIAWVLAVEMKSLLIGESASPAQVAAIVQALEGTADVDRVAELRTLHVGPDQVLVAARLGFSPQLTLPRVGAAIADATSRVRSVVPAVCWVYLEPAQIPAADEAPSRDGDSPSAPSDRAPGSAR